MVRLSGALERVPAADKVKVGDWLLGQLDKGEVSAGAVHWALGRLGARVPLYGSAHTVVPVPAAARWLGRLLGTDLGGSEQGAFAAAQLARLTHDRERDIDAALRDKVSAALRRQGGNEPLVRLVQEGGELGEAEQVRVFGDSLPAGLRLG